MNHTTTVVIGGGQAGLAMSAKLTGRSIDHVVLERGVIGNSWHNERWDSLRLLTPNWMTRLPGRTYDGPDPDGYMRAVETAAFLGDYARRIAAPVEAGVTVGRVTPVDGGFHVDTNTGTWSARSVVDATGACSTPRIPAIADELPGRVQQLTPTAYRNPAQVQPGRVLVVGASASGVQIADELARSGRDVILATGYHVRLPRTYRGMDIHWWMDTIGLLDERWTDVEDIDRARRVPSLQLVGSPDRRSIGLSELQRSGVEITGRLAGITDRVLQFSGSLANTVESAELKLHRLLDQLDRYATAHGLDPELPASDRPAQVHVPTPRLLMPIADVGAVVWATGFRPHHPAMPDQVKDRRGALRHDGGVVDHPGLYALGLPFQRCRKSAFLDGVGADAGELAAHLRRHLEKLTTTV
ncbi:MAG: NAD(P)-binding domain-containing protein [Ilumatobacter sp.]